MFWNKHAITVKYALLVLLMMPYTFLSTKWGMPNRILELSVVYILFSFIILSSRVLFLFSFVVIIQRIFEIGAYFTIGKVKPAVLIIGVEGLLLYPLADILKFFTSSPFIFFIVVPLLLVGFCLIYYWLAKPVFLRLLKKGAQQKKIKLFVKEAIFVLLFALVWGEKNKEDAFFFESSKTYYFINPVVLEKGAPISKNEGKKYNIDVYFIRGESATSANMSLYGYERKTTPYIDSIKNDLRYYYNAVSPETSSSSSESQVLSRGYSVPDNAFFAYPTLFEELKFQGIPIVYVTYNQSFNGYDDAIFDNVIENSVKVLEVVDNNDDKEVFEGLKRAVIDQPAFYYVLTGGSHLPYETRTPTHLKKFSKIPADNEKEKNINNYDDSILYTDMLLGDFHAFAERRKKKTGRNYVIWYVSDHSQVLYRDGSNWVSYALDKKSVIGRDVPFFIINSSALPCENRLPKKNTPKSEYLNTAQTFYWVLGSLCLYNGKELSINPPVLQK